MSLVIPIFVGGGEGEWGSLNFRWGGGGGGVSWAGWGGGGGSEKERVSRF